MYKFIYFSILWLPLLALNCQENNPPNNITQETAPARSVAITIDDLPTVRGRTQDRMQHITDGLLAAFAEYKMPAIGFVNESKLGNDAQRSERLALLRQWLQGGYELGNHTFSHPQFFTTPLADYRADFLRGEVATKKLLADFPQEMRYFRHPYLNTGPDLETKTAFEAFLKQKDYIVAPVTIDNDEYIYALAYDRAEEAGDSLLAAKVAKDYIRYMEEMFVFYEQLSRDLCGREPAQILLLHANALNADYLDDLAKMMQARGYRFISLAEALQDSVYQMRDTYTGRSGLSWLQRWWISAGNERRPEPAAPRWLRQTAYPNRD